MAVRHGLFQRVQQSGARHVRAANGFEEQSMINPLEPVDSVAAFSMARWLTQNAAIDYCIPVAPEGHVYGYFFHCLKASMLSVHVDYPPRECTLLDDFKRIEGRRVLILEDDVASGTTLRLVVSVLQTFRPACIDLYLGRAKRDQTLENVDSRISQVYLAEDLLAANPRSQYEAEFEEFFGEQSQHS